MSTPAGTDFRSPRGSVTSRRARTAGIRAPARRPPGPAPRKSALEERTARTAVRGGRTDARCRSKTVSADRPGPRAGRQSRTGRLPGRMISRLRAASPNVAQMPQRLDGPVADYILSSIRRAASGSGRCARGTGRWCTCAGQRTVRARRRYALPTRTARPATVPAPHGSVSPAGPAVCGSPGLSPAASWPPTTAADTADRRWRTSRRPAPAWRLVPRPLLPTACCTRDRPHQHDGEAVAETA